MGSLGVTFLNILLRFYSMLSVLIQLILIYQNNNLRHHVSQMKGWFCLQDVNLANIFD